MAEARSEPLIVRDLMDEPHLRGRRISVFQIHERVEKRGLQPETVAARYDLDLADVYHALAYYHEHPQEMGAIRTRRAQAVAELREAVERERPPGVDPTGEATDLPLVGEDESSSESGSN